MPKTCLLDWQLSVACFYPTTPTDYPNTTRGMYVGPPVAININVCGNPIFEHKFCLNFIGTVCHWKSFWSTARICFMGLCWYFSSQWTPVQAIINARSVRTLLFSWKKCAIAMCLHIYRCLWKGLGNGGVHSGTWMNAWPSRVLQHSKPQQFTE